MDYERMSNAELYALLKEKMPAVAETVGKVRDSNRETGYRLPEVCSNKSG